MPRPSSYTQETADIICERVAMGVSLHRICADETMPPEQTVYRWLNDFEAFRENYERARDRRADRFADEIIEIVDEEDDPARARGRMDARKWAASKLQPKKYGDKVTNEHTGKDGGPIETRDISATQRAKAVLALLNKAEAK